MNEIEQGRLPRRQFIKGVVSRSIAVIAAGGAVAAEPITRVGRARFRLSLAAYSFRDYFKPDANPSMDLHRFIDFCADEGCDGVELTSYYFPPKPDRSYLLELRRRAFLRGLAISGTAVGNNFALPDGEAYRKQIELVKQWIEYAAVLGAPHIRVFAGARQGISEQEAKKQCIRALEECAELAAQYGIWLGVENHGGIVTRTNELIDIVRTVRSRWVGVNLDTGNFYETNDPYRDLAELAPYAVNVHFKVRVNWPGKGRIPIDLERVLEILGEVGYQGYVALEYEEQDPWTEIPAWLARLRKAFCSC